MITFTLSRKSGFRGHQTLLLQKSSLSTDELRLREPSCSILWRSRLRNPNLKIIISTSTSIRSRLIKILMPATRLGMEQSVSSKTLLKSWWLEAMKTMRSALPTSKVDSSNLASLLWIKTKQSWLSFSSFLNKSILLSTLLEPLLPPRMPRRCLKSPSTSPNQVVYKTFSICLKMQDRVCHSRSQFPRTQVNLNPTLWAIFPLRSEQISKEKLIKSKCC